MAGSVASGSTSPSGGRPSTGSKSGRRGSDAGTAGADGPKDSKPWTEGEFAYEYVKIAQRRDGRDKIKFEMSMRQQPVQARMCGVGEKSDRRPVDPTPIVQLKVIDHNGDDHAADGKGESSKKGGLRRPDSSHGGMSYMQNPYYFLFACLVGGDEQEDELHVIDDGKTRFLTGTPVSSLYHLKDIDNSDAAFFVFPDLGVRKEGKYKLKLTLFEIVDQEVFYCTTLFTQTFSVFSAKKFPGMQKATDLSKTFADQGLKIRVRKDPRQKRGTKAKRKSSAGDSDAESADGYPKRTRLSLPPHAYDARDDPRHRDYPPYPPSNGYYHPAPGQYPPNHGHPMAPPPMPFDPYRPPQPPGYGYPSQYPLPPNTRPATHPAPPGPHSQRPHHSMPPQAYVEHPHQGPSNAHYQPPPSAYHHRPTTAEYRPSSPHQNGHWAHERDYRGHHRRPSGHGPPPPPPPPRAMEYERPRERDHERHGERDIREPPPLRTHATPVSASHRPSSIGSVRPLSARSTTPSHQAIRSPSKDRGRVLPPTGQDQDRERESTQSSSRANAPIVIDGSRPSSRDSSANGSVNPNGNGSGSVKDSLFSPSGSSQKTNRMGLGHLLD